MKRQNSDLIKRGFDKQPAGLYFHYIRTPKLRWTILSIRLSGGVLHRVFGLSRGVMPLRMPVGRPCGWTSWIAQVDGYHGVCAFFFNG